MWPPAFAAQLAGIVELGSFKIFNPPRDRNPSVIRGILFESW